jgi:hypothetical protein
MSKENNTESHELDPRIKLREPWIAGILAFLVPGAGHLYQRRFFKAGLYFVCILGIFFLGSSMGEAKAVHYRFDPPDGRKNARSIGYIAQVGVGLAALPAILQSKRYKSQEKQLTQDSPAGTLLEEFDTTFSGLISHRELGDQEVQHAKLVGKLMMGDHGSHEFEGTISFTSDEGEARELKLSGNRAREVFAGSMTLLVGPKICAMDELTPILMAVADHDVEHIPREFSAAKRTLMATIADEDLTSDLGRIYGTIPRAFTDHYQVPIEDSALQHLIRKHGKFFELALVYTWIAGLLNVLAVWDAVSGPAYGYGDEPELDQKKGDKNNDSGESESNELLASSDEQGDSLTEDQSSKVVESEEG